MKIVISAGGAIWNESHPCLKKYGDDVLVMRHGSAAELVARIGEDRNVAVLTDNDPASFEVFDILAGNFKSRRIHLFACLPFTYESRRRKQEILDRLMHLDMVKSLCLVPLDGFLAGSSNGETLGSLQLRIRNDMMALLMQAVEQTEGLEEFCQYRYDLENGSYVPCDFPSLGAELQERLFARRKPTAEQPDAQPSGQEGEEQPVGRPYAEPESQGAGTMKPAAVETSYGTDTVSAGDEITGQAVDPPQEENADSGREPETEIRAERKETGEREAGTMEGAGPEVKKHRNLLDFLRRKKV